MRVVGLFLCLLTIFLFPNKSSAQIQRVEASSGFAITIDQWEVVDILVKTDVSIVAPFDVMFGAVFLGPKGESLRVPGFYDGHNTWVVRFSSSSAGQWIFLSYSSVPELAGKKGELLANPNTDPARKGAVLVDPNNPQKFIYEDGTPYFALGFEIDWLFALDCESGELYKTKSIVSEMKDHGFNRAIMNVFAYDVNWDMPDNIPSKYRFNKPSCFPFAGSNQEPDFSALNVEFFKHLDKVIHLLDKEGIVSHLMIYVWNKKVSWPDMYTQGDNMYFDYVIARYQAFSNINWDISKEALQYGRCDMAYVTERIKRVRANDAFGRLLSVHDYNYCEKHPDKVDYISVQSWKNNLFDDMLRLVDEHPDKPVFNVEHGGYEVGPYPDFRGNYEDPKTLVYRNYLNVFAGVYSTYYWQNTSWTVVIYDPFNPEHTFSPPRFDYYNNLSKLFEKVNFNELGSERRWLSSSGYVLSNSKDLYLFLVADYNLEVNLVLPDSDNKKIAVEWFNIYTGEFISKPTIDYKHWHSLESPWPATHAVAIVNLID